MNVQTITPFPCGNLHAKLRQSYAASTFISHRALAPIAVQLRADPCSRRNLGRSNRGGAGRAPYDFQTAWIQELVNYSPCGLPVRTAARGRAAQPGAASTYL